MKRRLLEIADILLALEVELRQLQLWDAEPPEAAALSSQQPFAIDTLEFYQWLQFIFIPRISWIVESQGELPVNSDIAPMAEHYFQGAVPSGERVIDLLQRFDRLLG